MQTREQKKTPTAIIVVSTENLNVNFYLFFLFYSKFALTDVVYRPFFSDQHIQTNCWACNNKYN